MSSRPDSSRVRRNDREVPEVVHEYNSGSYFGEISLLTKHVRQAWVRASAAGLRSGPKVREPGKFLQNEYVVANIGFDTAQKEFGTRALLLSLTSPRFLDSLFTAQAHVHGACGAG